VPTVSSGGTGNSSGSGGRGDANSAGASKVGPGSGTANTGGGGGGAGNITGGTFTGGSGGSGVVILKYVDTKTITIGAGLTGTTAAPAGGFKVSTITAGTGNVSWV
jgi:hypothetical protein